LQVITRRSQVRILPPLLKGPRKSGPFPWASRVGTRRGYQLGTKFRSRRCVASGTPPAVALLTRALTTAATSLPPSAHRCMERRPGSSAVPFTDPQRWRRCVRCWNSRAKEQGVRRIVRAIIVGVDAVNRTLRSRSQMMMMMMMMMMAALAVRSSLAWSSWGRQGASSRGLRPRWRCRCSWRLWSEWRARRCHRQLINQ